MDRLADAFTKIRNAVARKHPTVNVAKSVMMGEILSILKKEGYIVDFKDADDEKFAYKVELKYVKGKSVIQGIKRVSRLSRRVYAKADALPRVFNNYGIAILTTSKGVMTDKEARSLGVGGEVICYVW
ncbi:MAG: 30S ribosomal protein S8 [Brevinematales bacterium]|nr:30S ribosomal protein S8 [Brevinematales bacterium]